MVQFGSSQYSRIQGFLFSLSQYGMHSVAFPLTKTRTGLQITDPHRPSFSYPFVAKTHCSLKNHHLYGSKEQHDPSMFEFTINFLRYTVSCCRAVMLLSRWHGYYTLPTKKGKVGCGYVNRIGLYQSNLYQTVLLHPGLPGGHRA